MKMPGKGVWLVVVVAAIVFAFFEGNRPLHFPPIPPRPLPIPNAYDFDCRAMSGVEAHERPLNIGYSYRGYYATLTAGQRGDLLKAVTPDLNIVRLGFAFRFAYPRVSVQPVHYPPPFDPMGLAQLFDLEARVKADRGDWYGAASSSLDAIRLGVDVPHGSSLQGFSEGRRCEEIGRTFLQLVVPNLTMVQLDKVKHRLMAIEADRSPFADTMLEAKYNDEAELIDGFHDRNWAKTMSMSLYAPSYLGFGYVIDLARMRETLDLNLMIDGKQALYQQRVRYLDAVIKASQSPYAAHTVMEHVPLDPWTSATDASDDIDPYARNSWFEAFWTNSTTQNDMMIVALALQQYHLKHHSYPRSLSLLVPTELASVPTDPFTLGKPLRYRQIGAAYLLYSVGPDGIDDGGAPVSGRVIQTSKGDVVYGINP